MRYKKDDRDIEQLIDDIFDSSENNKGNEED